MRRLEAIDSLLLAAYLLWPHPRPFTIRLLPSVSLLAILIHLKVERYRWQMAPLYALTFLLTVSSLYKINTSTDWPTFASYLNFILVIPATALPFLLPVPEIPGPNGPYQVGTKIYEQIDNERIEIYSGKGEARRFIVQVWYPATIDSTDELAPWMNNAHIYASVISTYVELPHFFLDHLTLVKMPAYKNAKIAEMNQPFPVILFSHGWNGFSAQNAAQAIQLASHGYVVISFQHTYGAVMTIFSDGTVAPNNPNALPMDMDYPNYEEVARKLVQQWVEDMLFTLKQFEGLNYEPGSVYFQKLDFARLGVYGHSTGAGAVIQLAGTDTRPKSLLAMDPFIRPVSAEVIEDGISQPSFFMFSQLWAEDPNTKNNIAFKKFYSHVQNSKGLIEIKDTKHYDFTDVPLLSPIASQLGLKGILNGKRVIKIVNAYLLNFFEMTLKDKPSPYFDDGFEDFPEVRTLKL